MGFRGDFRKWHSWLSVKREHCREKCMLQFFTENFENSYLSLFCGTLELTALPHDLSHTEPLYVRTLPVCHHRTTTIGKKLKPYIDTCQVWHTSNTISMRWAELLRIRCPSSGHHHPPTPRGDDDACIGYSFEMVGINNKLYITRAPFSCAIISNEYNLINVSPNTSEFWEPAAGIVEWRETRKRIGRNS